MIIIIMNDINNQNDIKIITKYLFWKYHQTVRYRSSQHHAMIISTCKMNLAAVFILIIQIKLTQII